MIIIEDIVYVLGAGISQVIRNYNGVSPPLINNFFIVGSRLRLDLLTKTISKLRSYTSIFKDIGRRASIRGKL